MTIEGVIAVTVDEYRIVVNIGSDDGVKESHRYGVYAESDPVVDPETGDELGRIEHKIAEVKPDVIKEEYTEMITDETEGGYSDMLSRQFAPQPKKLTSNPEFRQGQSEVQKGQKVKLIADLEDST